MCQLQNAVGAERTGAHDLFSSLLSFNFTLCRLATITIWLGGAETDVKSSQPITLPGNGYHLTRPDLFGPLLREQTCFPPSFYPVPSCLCSLLTRPALSVPSWSRGGKGDLFNQTHTFARTVLQGRANRTVCVPRCQPIPRRTQTPSTNRLLHWMPTIERVWVLCTNTPTEDGRVS